MNISQIKDRLRELSKRETYLDNAATTYVDPMVKKAMDEYFVKNFGNPGSFNTAGLRAKAAADEARSKVSEILGCDEKEIVFTAGGTESINLAVQGVARANKKKGKHMITTGTEHHAVLHTMHYLEKYEGFEITYLDVDKYGMVSVKDIENALRDDTILVSVIYANNEVGSVNPISRIGKFLKEKGVYFHTDACQAAGYLDVGVDELNVDLLTLNGSKIYGPKGSGILYVRKGVEMHPIIHGGGQEWKLRSGTENVPGIVGIAKALELIQKDKLEELRRLSELRDYMIRKIISKVPKTFLNGHPVRRLPNNVNLSMLDVEGEAVMLHLNEHGICASTGSACTSENLDPSHVIVATGLPYEAAHGSVRFTLGKNTTKKDVDKVLNVLPGIVEKLRSLSPLDLSAKEVRSEQNG